MYFIEKNLSNIEYTSAFMIRHKFAWKSCKILSKINAELVIQPRVVNYSADSTKFSTEML